MSGEQIQSLKPEVKTFRLRRRNKDLCSGLFWRPDPRAERALFPGKPDTDNWPKNGASVRGVVHIVKGKKWLQCYGLKQWSLFHQAKWRETKPGSWLPFDYGNYYLEET
eukprot:CAMPEP_0184046174 /NCGR_PEP_ID=MMETSP0956-20121227/1383_1 /TAXON_ID=627963 /ORGANISM="Aplanochytrium sp, Strain PBS07" /LENGTH=108 /DNA_ID=CAMNT_0026337675 /DNA_START=1546 /DNA_END=1872 /DNA_ORIENTATION=+